MPGPVIRPARPVMRNEGSAGPPPEAPDFLETVGAGFRVSLDEQRAIQENRLNDAYDPIVQALVERGQGSVSTYSPNVVAQLMPFNDNRWNADAIWQEVERARRSDPNAFADIGSREEFELKVLRREGGRARDQQTLEQGSAVAGFIGAVPAEFRDPINTGTLVIGGAGRTVAQRILTEAAANALIEAGQTPLRMAGRERLGEDMTAGEAVMNIATAAVGAGLIRGGFEAAPVAGKRISRAFADNYDRLPAAVRERWARDHTFADGELPDFIETLVGRENLSEAEQAAVDVMRRDADIAAGNPMRESGGAAQLHERLLGEAVDTILNAPPPPLPAFVPGVSRIGGETATAIGRATMPAAGDASERFMARVRRAESSGDDAARNPRSSATGRYQFTDGTWLAYYKRRFGNGGLSDAEILAKRGNGQLQDTLMRDLTADNAAFLRRQGEAVTEGNLYLTHFAGPGGARKLFEADGAANAAAVLGEAVAKANPFLRDMTVDDVIRWAHRKMDSRPVARGAATPEVDTAVTRSDAEAARIQAELDAVTARIAELDARADADPTAPDMAEQLSGEEPDALPVDGEDFDLPEDAPEPELPTEARAMDYDNPPAEVLAILPQLREVVSGKQSLNRIDALAEDIGASPQEVRAGLNLLLREGRIAMNSKTGNFMRKPPKPDADELLEFIASVGGLRDDEGHNLGLVGKRGKSGSRDWQRMTRRNGPLLRRKGRSVDEIGELLWERGWFAERPDVDTVLQLIEGRMQNGRAMFPPDKAIPVNAPDFDEDFNAAVTRTSNDLTEQLGYEPLSVDPDTLAELTDIRAEVEAEGVPPQDSLATAVDLLAQRIEAEAVDLNPDAGYEIFDYEPAEAPWPAGADFPTEEDWARFEPAGSDADPREYGGGYADPYEASGPELAELAPEARSPFLDSDAAPVRQQADSLEHDARAGRFDPVDYTSREDFRLDKNRKGWQGVPDADFSIAQNPDGRWTYRISWDYEDRGGAKPFGHGYPRATREGAIYDALNELELKSSQSSTDSAATIKTKNRIRAWTKKMRAENGLPGDGTVPPAELEADALPARATTETVADAPTLDNGAAVDPAIAARQAEEARLRAEAPMRGENATGQAQDGTMGLPMFDAADQPEFLLDAEGSGRTMSDLLADFDAEAADLKNIRDCM